MATRLAALDGVRALAILWVALFHYAVFWSPAGRGDPLLPYGDALAWIPLAAVGDLGVSLFFVVSGVVISLSLERSSGALDFALRRAVRLWPMLLLCGGLTFAVTSLLGPASLQRSLPEFLISMTFVPPQHVGRVLGHPEWHWLDGAYWSLWVEVRFYTVAALLHFGLRWSLLRSWAVVAGLCAAVHLAGLAGVGPAAALSRLLFAEYQPFLSTGVALACLLRGQERRLAGGLIAASIALAALYAAGGAERLIALTLVFALALGATLAPQRLPFLSWPPLTALGRASYGYYLLHQSIGLALLTALPMTGWASVGAMLASQAALLVLALRLHLAVEVPLGRALRDRLSRSAAPVPAP